MNNTDINAYTEYLEEAFTKKTIVNVFLVGGAMLSGMIKSYDSICVILDKCMILRRQMISIAPQKK